ncbi:hypothetical protein [Nostoc sp.]|uniref:hypothetical protein n=1 Tax=Nostoc sp. TaxID=1180 RepID=UPI002FF54C6A
MFKTPVITEEFKDSPIGKIPKDWDVVELVEEINIVHGYAFKGEYFSETPPGEVLLVPGNFHREGGLYFEQNNTKYYQGAIPENTVLSNGDLLIVMTDLSPRTLILGRVVQLRLPFKVLHNQRIGKIVLRLPDSWNKRFLMIVMNSNRVRQNIISTSSGTTVRHTSPGRITTNMIPKPGLYDQDGITEILDAIDKAIALTDTHITKLKKAKAGLLHDLLTRGIDDHGELRDYTRNPELFKRSVLGIIPKDWDIVTTEQAAAKVPGSTTIGPFGSNLLMSDYRSKGVPVVFVRDIKPNAFQWNSNIYIEQNKAKELASHTLEPSDLIATKMGEPPCVACVYPNWMPSGVITADIIRLRPDLTIATSQWLSTFINSESVARQVRGITGGVTRAKVTLRDFRRLLLALPNPIEQQCINKAIKDSEDLIRAKELTNEKLKLLKQGLMSDLLTGRVRVKI